VPTPAVSIAPAATAAPEAGRTTTPPGAESLNVLSGLVVGWLAIIAGPGRGEVLRLGYGVNDMGVDQAPGFG